MMSAITTITEMIPTTAPALKIPATTEQLLRQNISKIIDKRHTFFIRAV
jgi:hypothetical protein